MPVRGYVGRYGSDIGLLSGARPAELAVHAGPSATNPSYLALSPDGTVLYAALELQSGSAVGAYAVDGDRLRNLNVQPTGGSATCHVSVHPTGHYVFTADYGSGTVAVHPLEPDGRIGERSGLVQHEGSGPDQGRQSGPHAHQVVCTPSGEHVLAVDLGTDTVYRYRLCDKGLQPAGSIRVPPGSGPRHLAFHPSGRYAYVANELSSTVCPLDLVSLEAGEPVATVHPVEITGSAPSAIRVAADGRFCYVANRGPDTLAVLAVSADGSRLRLVGTVPTGGEQPRDFVLDGEYGYVANQRSNSVTVLRVDPATGLPTSLDVVLTTPAPACLVFR